MPDRHGTGRRDPRTAPVVGTLPPVNGEHPGPDEPGPDEPDHSEGETEGLRGWIAPEDRLWRHPSETGETPVVPLHRPRTDRRVVVGVAAAVVVLVGVGLAMAASGASPGSSGGPTTTAAALRVPPTTEVAAVHLAGAIAMAHAVDTVRPSLVELSVTRPDGTTTAEGVVAEAGGIIATTAGAVEGATAITARAASGVREAVQVVGEDTTSDLAVVRGVDDLPVAAFDGGDPVAGTTALAVSLDPGGHDATPTPMVYAGTVESSGSAVGADPATSTFAATAVDAPLVAADAGCALLDSGGEVSGLLVTTRPATGGTEADFLPAELVIGVTRELVTTGSIERGWLGVEASDAPALGGAVLDTVAQGGGASRAGLAAGDTLVAVDGAPVHSVAELRARLYAALPGSTVQVTYGRGAGRGTTEVVLDAAGPGGTDG